MLRLIHALDGSGALPEETLEYLEIQPPAEAILPWTDLDNKVSSWRRNQAVSPINVLRFWIMNFSRKKQ